MNYTLILAAGIGKRYIESCKKKSQFDASCCEVKMLSKNINCFADGLNDQNNNIDLKTPKQFIKVNGSELICHTLRKFESCKVINKIIVVCHNEYLDKLNSIICNQKFTKVCGVVKGGNHHWESILNGINYLNSNYQISSDDIVTIHGACAPLVNDIIIKDSVTVAKKYGASAASPSSTMTTWESFNNSYACKSVPRDTYKQVQYPFSFKIDVIFPAVKKYCQIISEKKFDDFSDINPVFNDHHKIYFSKGSVINIKVVVKEDLDFVKALL